MEPISSDHRKPVAVEERITTVIRYHQETKHHFFRYARSLGYLDWANQPDPFRRFKGAPLIPLPLIRPEEDPVSPLYADTYATQAVPSQPVSIRTLSRFLELTLALSAWKQVGDVRWALRINPSSGNLHPTEGYVLAGPLAGVAPSPALYHYAPKEHSLEVRAEYGVEVFDRLAGAFPAHAFWLGLTSIHWREAWKYGERAFRYCQHDAGHAVGAARIAAATLGWNMVFLDGLSDDQLQSLLGTNRRQDFAHAESEHPDCLAVVWPAEAAAGSATSFSGRLPLFLEAETTEALSQSKWYGQANRLSREAPVPWEIINEVTAASWKESEQHDYLELDHSRRSAKGEVGLNASASRLYPGEPLAGQIIRQRRSAVAFDGRTSISAASFFTMMMRVTPQVELPVSQRPMPWDCITWSPRIHLAIFVHRVDGLRSGLYFLVRDPAKLEMLRDSTHSTFLWSPAPDWPHDLPLFLLQEGDARQLAAQVSCHQEIAGDSAFSLGMVAEFESSLRGEGPWFYRRLFWESGIVGQVLYLEAEAAGVRSTGIGCYFDEPVHQVLGLKDLTFQSLYHFTVGGPVDDTRLTTLPPYPPARYGATSG